MRANALGKIIWTTYINKCVSPGCRQNRNGKGNGLELVMVSPWMSLDEVGLDVRTQKGVVVEDQDRGLL